MIKTVTTDKTTYADSPARFEAGTPPIVEAVGLAKAIEYLNGLGWENIVRHEENISNKLMQVIQQADNIVPLGTLSGKKGLVAFNIKGLHAYDVGTLLGMMGIAVRVGLHCAEPLAQAFQVSASVRVSLGLYNDEEDIQAFEKALVKVGKVSAR